MIHVRLFALRCFWLLGAWAALFSASLPAQSALDPTHQALHAARNRQDLASLHAAAGNAEGRARQSGTSQDLYSAALARSFEAEVALELGKKSEAAAAAESGIRLAQTLARNAPAVAEHHRLLGTLCGQIIPANLLSAFQYGRCAREEIDAALKIDPRSAWAHLGRGVGNYYLPESFGGGVEKAIGDFRHATTLRADFADAWLWLGIALRKKGDQVGAHQALSTATKLAPDRLWIRRQLEKARP